MASHPLNLALRFLLEVAAVVGFGYWGFRQWEGPARWVAVVALPLLAMALWGTFRVPDDPVPTPPVAVPGRVRLALELALFAAAVAAYLAAGARTFGWSFAALLALHYALSYDRIAWLLRRRAAGTVDSPGARR
jgi:hypothetical protein